MTTLLNTVLDPMMFVTGALILPVYGVHAYIQCQSKVTRYAFGCTVSHFCGDQALLGANMYTIGEEYKINFGQVFLKRSSFEVGEGEAGYPVACIFAGPTRCTYGYFFLDIQTAVIS